MINFTSDLFWLLEGKVQHKGLWIVALPRCPRLVYLGQIFTRFNIFKHIVAISKEKRNNFGFERFARESLLIYHSTLPQSLTTVGIQFSSQLIFLLASRRYVKNKATPWVYKC